MRKHADKFVLWPLGAGILCLIIGGAFDSRLLLLVGMLGMLPVALVIFVAVIGLVWTTLDDCIPDFRGKQILVGAIVLLVAGFLLLAAIGGGADQGPGSCSSYRGVPTC